MRCTRWSSFLYIFQKKLLMSINVRIERPHIICGDDHHNNLKWYIFGIEVQIIVRF